MKLVRGKKLSKHGQGGEGQTRRPTAHAPADCPGKFSHFSSASRFSSYPAVTRPVEFASFWQLAKLFGYRFGVVLVAGGLSVLFYATFYLYN